MKLIMISLFFFTLAFSQSDLESRIKAAKGSFSKLDFELIFQAAQNSSCDSICNSNFENKEKNMCNVTCDSLIAILDFVLNRDSSYYKDKLIWKAARDSNCGSVCNSNFENKEKDMCNEKCDSIVKYIDANGKKIMREIMGFPDSCGVVCQALKIKDSISVNFSMNAGNKKLSSKIDMQSLCLKDEASRLALFTVFEDYFYNQPTSTLIPLELKKEKNFWRVLTNWSFSENGSIFDVHTNICFTSKEAWVCDSTSSTSKIKFGK